MARAAWCEATEERRAPKLEIRRSHHDGHPQIGANSANGAMLGAEIDWIDLSQALAPEIIEKVQRAWDDHLVLLFRDQSLDEGRFLLQFAREFGELDLPGPIRMDGPASRLSGAERRLQRPRWSRSAHREPRRWGACLARGHDIPRTCRPKGAVLSAARGPTDEGDTYFANMIAACAALPDKLRTAIEGKHAVHDAAHNSAGLLRKGYEELTDVTLTPGPHHPLVHRDDRTGRAGAFSWSAASLRNLRPLVDESEALLDEIWAHASQPQFAWRHRWRPGDVLMWQNLWVLHRRDAFNPARRRILLRAQIRGDQTIQ